MAKLLSGTRIYGNLQIDTNVAILGSNVSTSTTTGAIVVTGGVGVGGNVYADKFYTTTGLYWAGNGNPISGPESGITYTASTTPPSGPTKGDQWYNTSNDVLYEYLFDGTSSYWVDIQTTVIAATASNATVFDGGIVTNITVFENNVVMASTTTSTSNVTGALVVTGGMGVAGNVYANKLYVETGLYWAGNSNVISTGGGTSTAVEQIHPFLLAGM